MKLRLAASARSTVQLPSPLSTPWLSDDPEGIPETTTTVDSPAVCGASIVSPKGIGASSFPLMSWVTSVGASMTGLTVMVMLPESVEVSPVSSSVFTTEIESAMGSTLFSGGVSVRPLRSPPVRVQLPSPLSVPAERVAPVGTPLMVTTWVSEPSVSTVSAMIPSGIAVSSSPLTSSAVRTMSSMTASTVTVKLEPVEVLSSVPSSEAVATTVSSKVPL